MVLGQEINLYNATITKQSFNRVCLSGRFREIREYYRRQVRLLGCRRFVYLPRAIDYTYIVHVDPCSLAARLSWLGESTYVMHTNGGKGRLNITNTSKPRRRSNSRCTEHLPVSILLAWDIVNQAQLSFSKFSLMSRHRYVL